MKKKINFLDIEIDKLTNSIENRITGEIFETEISLLTSKDLKQIKKSDWQFDWHLEQREKNNKVFKLTTVENPSVIHGIISMSDQADHVFIELVESAKFNKGREKIYSGVAANLIAFACKCSFEKKHNGHVAFIAKTKLISHYEDSLKAKHFRNNRMFIETKDSLTLVTKYFKNFKHELH